MKFSRIHQIVDKLSIMRVFFWDRHAIICGLGHIGPVIARYCRDQGKKTIIIEPNMPNDDFKTCRGLGALVLRGDATEKGMLEKANIRKAGDIFAVTGNDNKNLEIAITSQSCSHTGEPFVCHIHLDDPNLCSLLKSRQVRMHGRADFRIEFFNISTLSGYCLQQAYPPFPEDRSSPPDAHILVIGTGRMGETLIAGTVRRWWERYGRTGKKIKIALVDRSAEAIKARLEIEHPSLPRYCEIIPYNVEFMSQGFLSATPFSGGEVLQRLTSVYIALGDSPASLPLALAFREKMGDQRVPIMILTVSPGGFADIPDEPGMQKTPLENIHPFQVGTCRCCKDIILNGYRGLIARAIHTAYLAKKSASGGVNENDPSNRAWDDLNEELRESNYQQADFIYSQVQAIGCDIIPEDSWDDPLFTFPPDELEYLAEREHERWMRERIRKGWRYGPVKDTGRKISPYLVPYHLLDDEIKDYDRNTVRALPHILSLIRLKIIRAGDDFPER